MSPTLPSLKRAAVALVLLNALTVAVVVVCFESARHFQERSEEAVVSLANDMTQVSQAQAAAERMVAIGRAYLLANEPELLLRAQAADAKLGRTVQTIAASTGGMEERRSLEPLLASAKRYRDVFSDLLSGKTPPRDPRAISESLRKHLIPAREDLIARLEALATKKLEELDAVRAQARRGHARSLALMLFVGILGVAASVVLAALVGRGGRLSRADVAAPQRSGRRTGRTPAPTRRAALMEWPSPAAWRSLPRQPRRPP